jgi:hypothetical protein
MVKESSTHPWLSQIDTSSLPHAKAATLVNAYRRLIGNSQRERETQSLNHLSSLSIHQLVRSAFCILLSHKHTSPIAVLSLKLEPPCAVTRFTLGRTLSCWCSKLVGSWPRTWRYGNAGVLNQLFGTND